MKKIILLLLLVLVSISASARKSYITVYTNSNYGSAATGYDASIRMSGDVPDNIEGFGYDSYTHTWSIYVSSSHASTDVRYSAGEILNLLSEYGYEVEFVDYDFHCFLLSKEISSGSQTEIVGDVNNDSEVNIGDVNAVVKIILGLAKSNPSIMKQLKEQLQ